MPNNQSASKYSDFIVFEREPVLSWTYQQLTEHLTKTLFLCFLSIFCLHLFSPGELLPRPHPADEDQPDILLVSGFRLFSALRPPGGAVPAHDWRPPVCDRHQCLCCGHGWEEQLLRSVSRQLEGWWKETDIMAAWFFKNYQTALRLLLRPPWDFSSFCLKGSITEQNLDNTGLPGRRDLLKTWGRSMDPTVSDQQTFPETTVL